MEIETMDEDQYERVLETIDKLMVVEKLTEDQSLTLEFLVAKVQEYERKHYSLED